MASVLRLGSKGEEVKKLQRLLACYPDGIFGEITLEAVLDFQKTHNDEQGNPLVADGIVGPKTWAALGVKSTTTSTSNSKCVDPSVIYAPLKACITRSPNRTIKYLAIHYTAGASSAPGRAKNMKASWEKTRRASADFGVDDRDMVQFNPDPRNYKCWAVGDKKSAYSGGGSLYGKATNANTISIEICSNLRSGASAAIPNHDGWYFTDAALDNAVRLAKILMKKFNIPIERVVRHYDISGKVCPGVIGWTKAPLNDTKGNKIGKTNDESEWLKFKKRLL